MTRSTPASSNKTALRASLNKENQSLAERLGAGEAAVVGTSAAAPAALAEDADPAASASAAPVEPAATAGAKAARKKRRKEKRAAATARAAKKRRDKLVAFSVDLLKSEEAAIELLRAELANGAGWEASRSDILRAGVRLFAEQNLAQMTSALDSLAALPRGKK